MMLPIIFASTLHVMPSFDSLVFLEKNCELVRDHPYVHGAFRSNIMCGLTPRARVLGQAEIWVEPPNDSFCRLPPLRRQYQTSDG